MKTHSLWVLASLSPLTKHIPVLPARVQVKGEQIVSLPLTPTYPALSYKLTSLSSLLRVSAREFKAHVRVHIKDDIH